MPFRSRSSDAGIEREIGEARPGSAESDRNVLGGMEPDVGEFPSRSHLRRRGSEPGRGSDALVGFFVVVVVVVDVGIGVLAELDGGAGSGGGVGEDRA